jgi:hypothetical protein
VRRRLGHHLNAVLLDEMAFERGFTSASSDWNW